MLAENEYSVGRDRWRSWSEHARRVFNSVYLQMSSDVGSFMHTNADVPPATHWNVTAWNAAWTAADAVDEERRALDREAA